MTFFDRHTHRAHTHTHTHTRTHTFLRLKKNGTFFKIKRSSHVVVRDLISGHPECKFCNTVLSNPLLLQSGILLLYPNTPVQSDEIMALFIATASERYSTSSTTIPPTAKSARQGARVRRSLCSKLQEIRSMER